jgi:hypothetical protein
MKGNNELMAEEIFEHCFEKVRYEASKFPLYDIGSVAGYLTKYFKKKYSANPDLIRHFRQQQSTPFPGNNIAVRRAAHDDGPDLRLSMVGDLMWMRKGWGSFLSKEVLEFLKGRDIVLGNLETPVSPSNKVIECLPDLFSFNSPTVMLDHLAECFTAVSIINNHSLDQGITGLYETIRELDKRNVLHAGACTPGRDQEYAIMHRGRWRIAFLAYGWGLNHMSQDAINSSVRLNIMDLYALSESIDYSIIEKHIDGAKKKRADLIICSLHWGHEFEMYPTFNMMKIARELISRGVDVIMGHHPHVLQPFEIIDVNADRPFGFDNIQDSTRPETRRAVVTYSLGNFVTAMYTRECLQSCIFNLNYLGHNGRLMLDGISYLPTFCSKTLKGEFSPHVVSMIDELRKERPPELKKELVAGLRDVTRHMGEAFLFDNRDEKPERN